MATQAGAPPRALEGLRVLDLSQGVAGPYCTKLLADYGASVVKVEPPGGGDPARQAGPFPEDLPHRERSALFLHLNTSKRSITLDVASARGRLLLKQLLPHFDVLVESYTPGTLAELGLSDSVIKRQHRNLVVTSITPYGQTGPYSHYRFTELTVFGTGGGMYREGFPDREPLKVGGNIGQYFAGTCASVATLAAALKARFTGKGEWLDISIMECLAGHPHQVSRGLVYDYSREVERRQPPHTPALPGTSGYGVGTFRCRDGHVTFLPLGERMWPNIVEMLGMPELLEDPRFATGEARTENRDNFDAIFLPWLLEHTKQEVFQAAQEAGVPGAPLNQPPDVLADTHMQEREYFVQIDHPEAGSLLYPGAPFKLSHGAWHARRAPKLGEHNQEVYRSLLNMGQDDLAQLQETGVI